jgi:hypothetical protein
MDSSKENDIICGSFGVLGSACGSDALDDLMAFSDIPVCWHCIDDCHTSTSSGPPRESAQPGLGGINFNNRGTHTVRHTVAGILGISKSASEISARSCGVTKEVEEACWISLAIKSLVQVFHRSRVVIISRTVNDQRQEQAVDK